MTLAGGGNTAQALKAIAAGVIPLKPEAGISRRTFFYYFHSKEAILMEFMRGGFVKALRPTLLEQSTDQTPLAAVRNCLLQLMSFQETEEVIVIDRLLGSTEALQARKQAAFVEGEQSAFEALCELWLEPGRRASLRIVAMVSIGALRLAKEAWRQEGGKQPLTKYLRESFAALEMEI